MNLSGGGLNQRGLGPPWPFFSPTVPMRKYTTGALNHECYTTLETQAFKEIRFRTSAISAGGEYI